MTLKPEDVFILAKPAMVAEVTHILETVSPDEFTASEMVAFAAVLRPIWERYCAKGQKPETPPAAVLSLVPSNHGRKVR